MLNSLKLVLKKIRTWTFPAFAVRQNSWSWFSSTMLQVLDCWAWSSSPSWLARSTGCPCRPGSLAVDLDWCHWISIVGSLDWTLRGSGKTIWLMIHESRRCQLFRPELGEWEAVVKYGEGKHAYTQSFSNCLGPRSTLTFFKKFMFLIHWSEITPLGSSFWHSMRSAMAMCVPPYVIDQLRAMRSKHAGQCHF